MEMEIVVTAVSAVLLLLGFGTLLFSFLRGRGEYDDEIEPLDEDEFKLKSFLCAGMYLDEHIELLHMLPAPLREILRKYNGWVTSQITELYGAKERDTYCQIHRANKWVMALLAFAFMAVFALICCSTNSVSNAVIFAAASPVALVGMPFVMDQELNNKIEKRREEILMEFPEFVNKLILLVNAGSTIPKAWEKIVSDSKSKSPLFRELRMCASEMQTGKPEAVAYEEFARRCKIKEVIKFVSVIILNLHKGGSEVIPTLRAQSDECWEARKATARRLGEKASSKLLGPMAIMLLGVILIVALPAILALSGL